MYEIAASCGRIDSVSLKRDTFGNVRSAVWIAREPNHDNVKNLHYMKGGCAGCKVKSVKPVLIFHQNPASIWEGYYCSSCGRWFWVRPMTVGQSAVREVRHLLDREGWEISGEGEKYVALRDVRVGSAVDKEHARQSRLIAGQK